MFHVVTLKFLLPWVVCLFVYMCPSVFVPPLPFSPIDIILKLMTVGRITGKIIRTTIIVNYICTRIMEFLQFYV